MDKASGAAMGEDERDEDRLAFRKMTNLLRKSAPSMFMLREAPDYQHARRMSARMKQRLAELARERPGALGVEDIDGRSALCWLSRYDAEKEIELFLALGADPLTWRQGGAERPLASAAGFSWGPPLAALVRATGIEEPVVCGAGRQELDGAAALAVAAYVSNERGIADLLALGADPGRTTSEGFTALHALCLGRKALASALPCARLLLAAQPKLAFAVAAGMRPDEVAAREGNELASGLAALRERGVLEAGVDAAVQVRARPRL